MAEHNAGALADQAALVTGGARRLGAAMVRALHAAGANVSIHCNHSRKEADALAAELVAVRPGSAQVLAGDLLDPETCRRITHEAASVWGRLDIVVNNASSFYPTAIGSVDAAAFDDLVGSNLRAPFFVAQAAAPSLRERGGCVVNMADIHGLRPRDGFPVYCAAKAGLVMLTRSLARELAPAVRVNAIAPGSILWPEGAVDTSEVDREAILAATPLGRQGTADDITATLMYLVKDAPFVTGQVLPVDGGRGL
jgi:pteridine reductase